MNGSWISRFRRKLVEPVDGASLGFFRMWFGGCMAVEVFRYFDHGWIERYFIQPVMTFTLPGFDFLRLWSPTGMYVHFVVMGLAAVCVMLGVWYRVAIVTLFLTHLYIFVIDEANYLNHFYLIALIGFLMIWMPADRALAVRFGRTRRKRDEIPTVPFWTVFLLRAQMFIVYFYAGIAKLNPDWLQGQPLAIWLSESDLLPVVGPLMFEHWFALALAYGGMLYDLSIGFLLLFRKTRIFGILWSAGFHFANIHLFQIGIFPWMAMGATLIFLKPNWPRTVAAYLRSLLQGKPRKPVRTPAPAAGTAQLLSAGTTAFVAIWIALQVLVPLRHWLYPGNVSWTEEGHTLSWHMKLREKDGELRSVTIEHPRTGERIDHDPREILTRRQYRKMTTRPRLVHHYVQWLAGQYEKQWGVRPRVYVELWASLNGRRYQPLIDPTTDLAAVRMPEGRNSWIVPLSVSLMDRAEGTGGGVTWDD